MTTGKRSSDARRSLDYAEKQLKVHEVYDQLLETRTRFNEATGEIMERRDRKRTLDAAIYSREMDLILEEAEHHPEMSVAAMERHMKKVLYKDDALQGLRAELAGVVGEIDAIEHYVRVMEADIKIGAARLEELGGYLQYLAAIKQHSMTSEANKTSEAGEA